MEDFTVLIVDDNKEVRKTVEAFINAFNSSVVIIHAEDGDRAWELINTPGTKIDLVISDIDMPGMNGIRLAEKVRRYCPGVRVILMSGDIEPETHDAHVFLAKPISMSDLLETIKGLTKPSQP